jgi:hypothetical protein
LLQLVGGPSGGLGQLSLASCIVLNFSYYEAPTFYNVKRIATIVPYRDRPWILEAETIATAFTNILFFVFKRRELCACNP